MTHEYAVRSGHPNTRTTSATPTRLHSEIKSMSGAKTNLHTVQEKTGIALHSVQREDMNLTRTQAAALLHFAGKAPRTIGTNHQINGEKACIKKGLIAREWVGLTEKRWLTENGAQLVNQLAK